MQVPRSRFLELFDDPATMPRWQKDVVSVEHLSGEPRRPGARSRLTVRRGRGTVEMTETVTRHDLPYAFEATYDAKGVHNVVRNEFHEAGPDATRWVAHHVFEFSGVMTLVGVLFGRAFPKASHRDLEAFKAFAESEPRA